MTDPLSPENLAQVPEVDACFAHIAASTNEEQYREAEGDLIAAIRDAVLSAERAKRPGTTNDDAVTAAVNHFVAGGPLASTGQDAPAVLGRLRTAIDAYADCERQRLLGMTPEHDADVAYYQREVWHVAESTSEGHPERAELYAEVKRLGEVRRLIRQVSGAKPCGVRGTSMCALLEGHNGIHAYYERPMWPHFEEES